ncbi:MAG: caspase family protein [Phormidium sp. BM_Day4_Bin.17]|nr:caspase family protein [Phormidium sp. BM_Day4_Bin.17]UCJ13087.1 MAG: caspase family protein [Phormidium sp. PBR-2020]
MCETIKILIIESQANWRAVFSKGFHRYEKSNKFCSIVTHDSASYEDAMYKLENENYNIILVNDVLESINNKIPEYEGLYIFDYLNQESNFKNTLKILIKINQSVMPEDNIKTYQEKYCLDYVYIQAIQTPIIKNIIDDIMVLYKTRFQANNMRSMNQFKNGYALLIGVGYNDTLTATVNDANNLHDVLINPKFAAYPQQQVQVLTEEASTKNNILVELDALADKVKKNPEATVWIYYSGHGFFCEETRKYFLVPYGYSVQQLKEDSISSKNLSEKIGAIQAKKLIVWLDCCHAGGMLSKELDGLPFHESPPPKGIFEGLDSGSGRVVIASCKENQKSYILPEATNSVFTTCLLEVLQGQGLPDSDDEYIRFFQVMSYLYEKVPELVKTKPQNPILVSGEGIDDNFAVCCRPKLRRVTSEPSNRAPQTETKREANFETNKIGTTSDSLSQILKKQLQDLCSQLSLLNQKIGKLERAKIINANPLLDFDIEQNISKLKEDRKSLEIEIEDLNRRLSESR